MPTNPSFDQNGLSVLRTAQIRENLVEAIRSSPAFGPGAQTGSDHLLGQLLDLYADRLNSIYELLQSLWDGFDPDSAVGVALDHLCALVGVKRQNATFSKVTLTLSGTPSTVIEAGKRARVPGGPIFALDANATIIEVGTVDATATCTIAGPYEAPAGTINEIVDSVVGWESVQNASDANIGSTIEVDSLLRTRREQSLSAGGTSTDPALKHALENLDDITAAVVISNRTDETDSNGILPHSYRAVVWPSTGINTARLAETIWDHQPMGITSTGNESATLTYGSENLQTTIRWAYASQVAIYWDVGVTKTSSYPSNGDDLVRAAVLAYGNALSVGGDVLPIGAIDSIYDSVPGISHLVVTLKAGSAPGSGDTAPITIALTEISDHDSTRITVAS